MAGEGRIEITVYTTREPTQAEMEAAHDAVVDALPDNLIAAVSSSRFTPDEGVCDE